MIPTLSLVRDGGVKLAGREWRSAVSSVVFYVHGIQSHSGWLETTAHLLRGYGVSLIAWDRRGSGASGGARGDAPSGFAIIEDYTAALDRTLQEYEEVTVVGQSFGGSIVAAMLAAGTIPGHVRVVLCAPALRQQRDRHTSSKLEEIRALRGQHQSALQLSDEQYTSSPIFLGFMRRDGAMLRSVTDNMRRAMVELEDVYVVSAKWPRTAVTFLAEPREDSIINLSVARQELRRHVDDLSVRVFDTDEHFLEFSRVSHAYLSWLGGIASGSMDSRP